MRLRTQQKALEIREVIKILDERHSLIKGLSQDLKLAHTPLRNVSKGDLQAKVIKGLGMALILFPEPALTNLIGLPLLVAGSVMEGADEPEGIRSVVQEANRVLKEISELSI